MDFKQIIQYLKAYEGEEIKLMEVCGTHTNSIFTHGIRSFLSPKIKLLSGPGCPVCVTPKSYIDEACRISTLPNHVLYTYGDMLKVPGAKSLEGVKALGGKVEILYSPLDIIEKAKETEDTLVLTAVGFETTAPLYALLLEKIKEEKIGNIRLLTSLKAIIPALEL
jgi:hydrogenase expression/formation protein HypD